MAKESDTLEGWLSTVEVADPPRWAVLEYEITRRTHPRVGGGHAVVIAMIVLLVVVFFCGPYLTLLLVAVSASAGDALPNLAFGVALVGSIIGISEPVLAALYWWGDKRRTTPRLVLAAGAGLASHITYLLLRASPDVDDTGRIALQSLVAVAAGLVMTVVLLVSKRDPYGKLTMRVRLRTMISPPTAIAFAKVRKQALHDLIAEGKIVVSDDVVERANRQPLGAWHRLDA